SVCLRSESSRNGKASAATNAAFAAGSSNETEHLDAFLLEAFVLVAQPAPLRRAARRHRLRKEPDEIGLSRQIRRRHVLAGLILKRPGRKRVADREHGRAR